MVKYLEDFQTVCRRIVLNDDDVKRVHDDLHVTDIFVIGFSVEGNQMSGIVKPKKDSSLTFSFIQEIGSQVVSVEVNLFHSKFTVIV